MKRITAICWLMLVAGFGSIVEQARSVTVIDGSGLGLSYYCNKTWPTGDWSLTWGGSDPCNQPPAGGTIAHAGLYSTTGLNNVVAQCGDGASWEYTGYGDFPLSKAYSQASGHRPNCTFVASPQRMPILSLPYDSNKLTGHGQGFDFDRGTYDTCPQCGASTILDYRGTAGHLWGEDNHDGNDFGCTRGDPIYAAADGDVITAGMMPGFYATANDPAIPTLPPGSSVDPGIVNPPGCTPTTCKCSTTQSGGIPDCGSQGWITIQHTVRAGNSSTYDESFATLYQHLQQVGAQFPVCASGQKTGCCDPVDPLSWTARSSGPTPVWTGGKCHGISVKRHDVVGFCGSRGGSSGPHVHFGVFRLTNTAHDRIIDLTMPDQMNQSTSYSGPRSVIDPYGWRGYQALDPWSYKSYKPATNCKSCPPAANWPLGAGAMSIHLWAVPDPPNDWPSSQWKKIPQGCALSIASGWFIGCSQACSTTQPVTSTCGTKPDPGGYAIFQWDLAAQGWNQIPDSYGMSISVDLQGNPWVINASGSLYRWNGSGFTAVPVFDGKGNSFAVSSVASGTNGLNGNETWVIQKPTSGSDGAIWNWSSSNRQWQQVPGSYATKIAVFSTPTKQCGDHVPWVINAQNIVFQYADGPGCGFTGGSFSQQSGAHGSAHGLDITTDFVVGTDYKVYQWNPYTSDFDHPPRGTYSAAPFNQNTKLGGWVNGFFAMDVFYGTIWQY